jgi:hypothetical protein
MARDSEHSAHAAISRRGLIKGTLGGVAGAALGTGLWTPALALADDDDEPKRGGIPLPIPHLEALPFGVAKEGVHFYFPGPVDGSAAGTDPKGVHPEGRDPSTVNNFRGFIGQVDLTFKGTGRDTTTGATRPYSFHTDTRFMSGEWIGSDQRRHRAVLAFI